MARSRAEARYNSLMQLCVVNDYFEEYEYGSNNNPRR